MISPVGGGSIPPLPQVENNPIATRTQLSWAGRAGLILFAAHVVSLFFPPIPPDVKGSLWSYVAAYLSVLLLLIELGRAGLRPAQAWLGMESGRRWVLGLGLAAGALALAVSLQAFAPELYGRFSREEGVWEPLSLLCYLGGAVVLFGAVKELPVAERKGCSFVGGVYVLLALEEIDYFGIFGGMIGRVQGIYAGSLHDLIMLYVEGALSRTMMVVIAGLAVAVIAALWWSGYLQPRALFEMVTSVDFLWASVGFGFLFAAAAAETRLFDWVAPEATMEEPIELAGAICLFAYALLIARRHGRGETLVRSTT